MKNMWVFQTAVTAPTYCSNNKRLSRLEAFVTKKTEQSVNSLKLYMTFLLKIRMVTNLKYRILFNVTHKINTNRQRENICKGFYLSYLSLMIKKIRSYFLFVVDFSNKNNELFMVSFYGVLKNHILIFGTTVVIHEQAH